MTGLSEKVAIVTGAGNGIGFRFAERLAAAGTRVALVDRDRAAAEIAATRISEAGGAAIALRADISNERETEEVVKNTLEQFGSLDILINNAALYANIALKPIEEVPLEEWDRVMAVNLRGLFLMTRAVVPHMKAERSGKIVNMSSNTVFSGAPQMLHYVTSKAGVIGFTRSLAKELGLFGICVNAITPGLTDTAASESTIPSDRFDVVIGARALKRRQTPDDLLGALLFLVSPESDFITGQVLNVDGGQILH